MLKYLSKDYLLRFFFLLISYLLPRRYVMFIPHKFMSQNDQYSILNYRSDSALAFANYILSNDLLKDKNIIIVVSITNDLNLINKYLVDNFPYRSVDLIYLPSPIQGEGSFRKFKRYLSFYWKMSQCSHVFTSQTPLFRPIASSPKIVMVDLGYYMAPIKDSPHDRTSKVYTDYQSMNKNDFDYYIVSSEVSKRLIMGTYGFDYNQFKILGMCRNDYLFSSEYPNGLRESLIKDVAYDVKKVILYIPTHRDNLSNISQFSAAKSLFGFDADLNKLNSFFQKEGILMICKVHPKQQSVIKQTDLPLSISLFRPNNQYGLSELMKISDALVTDYTSGYFDYLILDKPVIFNLYDINDYADTRGLIFNPIDPICAGDIIHNETEFLRALANLDLNKENYREKRKDILNMLYYYKDSNACKRVYEFFFDGRN